MSKSDKLALLISIVAVLLAIFVSQNIYEELPHIEDEITYVWQANLAVGGKLVIDSPICPTCFLQPFIIDLDGVRFGKYPPGWPAMLSLGIQLGSRNLIAPVLGGFSIWLIYLLIKKILDEKTAILAILLLSLSPFYLMNAGSLLSHTWSLFLTAAFMHAWLDTFSKTDTVPDWLSGLTAALCLAGLALTRPLTAIGVSFPFIFHGLYLLLKGTVKQRKNALSVALIAIFFSSFYFVWQYALTGDMFQSPYTLYWPYDKIGFGPDVGLHSDGHQLKYAWANTRFSLVTGASDLFGWPKISWLFLPFGLFAIRKNKKALLLSSVILSLVLIYSLYWIGAWLLGPRYYFEGLISLVLLTSTGYHWLAGKFNFSLINPNDRWKLIRFSAVTCVAALLIIGNLIYYLPHRLGNLKGLYGISQERLEPFLSEQARELTPALIIVHPKKNWLEYGGLLDLSDPFLDTPFIFTHCRSQELNQLVSDAFPERITWHYYPDEPYKFYSEPR